MEKRKSFLLLMAVTLTAAMIFTGCGEDEAAEAPVSSTLAEPIATVETVQPVVQETETPVVTEEEDVLPEGKVRSELTGEIIDEALANQRPVALMIDNEKTALPHYGLNSADVVYEIMNSTKNDRITRLMAIIKDYAQIEQMGSIRSARPTNFMLIGEYNAILIHDGGPACYIDEYIAKDYVNNLSGGFARFSNGKATEFTEYVTYDGYTNNTTGKSYSGLKDRLAKSGYDTEYNNYYFGEHFNFNPKGVDLTAIEGVMDVTTVELPFKHTSTKLNYNATTGLYEYSEYGEVQKDPMDGNNVTAFKNLIIYNAPARPCEERGFQDQNGYTQYDLVGLNEGYYITEGKAIPIKIAKEAENTISYFYQADGSSDFVEFNVGKTYISIVPTDIWDNLVIK